MSDTPDETHRILNQADALMNRHRSPRVFVARGVTEEVPSHSVADEDFPVLTEIVSEINLRSDGESDVEKSELASDPEQENIAALQRQQIEAHVEHWLDSQLPDEVLRVMDGVSDQLIVSLVARIREELLPELLSVVGNRIQEGQQEARGTADDPRGSQQAD